jgi:hypothetical protein
MIVDGGTVRGKMVHALPKTLTLRPIARAFIIRILNVRVESAPPDAPKPSALLKFDMLNDGDSKVTDIVIRITIVEKLSAVDHQLGAPRVLVGPFWIRGSATIEAGYTVNYEMLLRNFSSACECVARVVVVSARSLPDCS